MGDWMDLAAPGSALSLSRRCVHCRKGRFLRDRLKKFARAGCLLQ
ncbi:hypothetical protein [Azospirillum palustre]